MNRVRASLQGSLLVLALLASACAGSRAPGGSQAGTVPIVASFIASPSDLPAGGGLVTLSWAVSGADQVVIAPNVGPVGGSSTQVRVTGTTFFSLTARNQAGIATKSTIVTVAPDSRAPVVLSFAAVHSNLPTGGGRTTLTWRVLHADQVVIDHGVGAVSGDSVGVDVDATTVYTLTATNASGSSSATTAVVVGQNPSESPNRLRYVHMVSPTRGESFVAPASLRLVAAAFDGTSAAANRSATKVQFFVDDTIVLEVTGTSAEFWVFKGFVGGIPSGVHRVWARALCTSPDEVYDSEPTIIEVSEPPAYDRTVNLTADVVLSGGQGYELVGSMERRVRLNGNGHRIVTNGPTSGNVVLRFVDVFDLGDRMQTGSPGLDIETRGTVVIEDSNFDSSNGLHVRSLDSSAASIRRNLFRSNMRMPLAQQPEPFYSISPSFPLAVFDGGSSGDKVFAGNNVGASWVHFQNTRNWVIGGAADEDSNILIGPRVGIWVQGSSDVQVRRNFSHHVYYGGWSQGCNFELQNSPAIVVEHNVVYGSSWPVRGLAGEFRYNLVLEAGHQWMWASASGGYVHHNVFLGGEADGGGIWVAYDAQNVRILNNTLDALKSQKAISLVKIDSGSVLLSSNVFMNQVNAPTVAIGTGTHAADYNLFFNPQATNYSDGRQPAHDVGGGAQVDPLLADPATKVFDLDEASVWKRNVRVREVLGVYRARYAPKAGSPAIDSGDPAGGTDNDVGAVGAGEPNASDQFGRL